MDFKLLKNQIWNMMKVVFEVDDLKSNEGSCGNSYKKCCNSDGKVKLDSSIFYTYIRKAFFICNELANRNKGLELKMILIKYDHCQE